MSRLEKLIFILSTALVSFLLGFVVYHLKIFPYSLFRAAYDQAMIVGYEVGFGTPHHLFPANYERAGVNVLDGDAVQPGTTLLTSYWAEFDWSPGIMLIDGTGRILHSWKTDPQDIFSKDLGAKRRNYVHGTYLYPDGDIIFNIEFVGLVRMNACGDVVWVVDYDTHHSLERDENGNFWVPGNVKRDSQYLSKYPGLEAPVFEDHILLVSPEGDILRDINLLDVIYENDLQRYLQKIAKRNTDDIFHLNDVEPLPSRLADEYPMFEAGDLVVSLKYLHMILVVDAAGKEVKWYSTDHVIEQHDPDFIGNGWIGIFDNNSDYTARGEMLGGSRLLAVRPDDGDSKMLYPIGGADPFYTYAGGKWQQLDNGNMLIVEARSGRAFEVDQQGRLVWEWIQQRYDDDLVAEVLEATRYPYTSEQISEWDCSVSSEVGMRP